MRCVPAEAQHATALRALLQHGNGCFCRWWHFEGDDHRWTERCNVHPAENARELDAALAKRSEDAQGIVALAEERAVGWLKLAPARAMAKLFGRRLYRDLPPADRSDVLIVGCIVVAPDWRRRGVARALVAAAVEHGRASGARAIEAYPRRPREAVRDDELWMGPSAAFEAAGFVAVAGDDPYPVLRCSLSSPGS